MAEPTTFPGDIRVAGNIRYGGVLQPDVPRSNLVQEDFAKYPVNLVNFRVWDAFHTNLPGVAAADDLGLIGGTWSTGTPSLQTHDVKAAGAQTLRARCTVQLPPEYVAGQSVQIRCRAGMLTTVADTSATVDVEVFKSNKEGGVSGADLVTTAAQSCNSTTLADKDFNVDPATLSPGDVLDVRVTMAINDAATGTTVKGILGSVELMCDIKG